MTTYQKNGHLHGKFHEDRNSKFEKIGRYAAMDFSKQKGFEVENYDRDKEGVLLWDRTDLIITDGKVQIHLEAATKRSNLFSYIYDGVDIETRKLKYLRKNIKSFVAMCDYVVDKSNNFVAGKEMLIIPMNCLQVAQDDCKDEFAGQGAVSHSQKFQMPLHGCHRVRKKCSQGYKQVGDLEDFYRIPYSYIAHFRKDNLGHYIQISKPTKRI